MTNSEFEYVKHFEFDDIFFPNNWIVVRINGKNFTKFCDAHEFIRPNDIRGLELMNHAAKTVMNEFRDIIVAFGASDEFSFIFRKDTQLYNRRKVKLISQVASDFSSSYVSNWNKYFENRPLKFPLTFGIREVLNLSDENLRDYLSWRQDNVHYNNLYNTSFWNLIQRQNMTLSQAQETLTDTSPEFKNDLLFHNFGINYNNELPIFRKGSTLIQKKVPNEDGKMKKIIVTIHEDIIGHKFWRNFRDILGGKISFYVDSNIESRRRSHTEVQSRFEYFKNVNSDVICLRNCWIVVRVDGKGFTRFCETHQFAKPNDIRGLELMNSAATSVMNVYPEIVLAFGASDEYSFVLKKDTELFNRQEAKLLSYIVSLFSSSYLFNWSKFFGHFSRKSLPSFDARVVLYPSDKNLRDYISWRQVEVHSNNLYNTCFWNLIQRKNMTPSQAEGTLRSKTSTFKKNLLLEDFGINYNHEQAIFRKGTTLIRKEMLNEQGIIEKRVVAFHEDIIGDKFWRKNSEIIREKKISPWGIAFVKPLSRLFFRNKF